jgi:hypothetical protein
MSGSAPVLRWNTVTGRVYSVLASTNVAQGFTTTASNLPAAIQSFTNPINNLPGTFYRLEVRKP